MATAGLKGRKGFAALCGYPILLTSIFIVSFAVPIVFAARVLGFFEQNDTRAQEAAFENARVISSGGQLEVRGSADLQPVPGEDFLLLGWFKLTRLPKAGERVTLFSKYGAEAPAFSGYALALERKGDEISPVVYWRDNQANGRWYSFSPARIVPKVWFMLALSFQNGKTLGLHAASLHTHHEERLQLLGGYNLDPPVMPESTAGLRIGSALFRGVIGPVGVFSAPSLSDDYQNLYQPLWQQITKLPKELEKAARLWSIDARNDTVTAGRSIQRVKLRNPEAPRKKPAAGAEKAKASKGAAEPRGARATRK